MAVWWVLGSVYLGLVVVTDGFGGCGLVTLDLWYGECVGCVPLDG